MLARRPTRLGFAARRSLALPAFVVAAVATLHPAARAQFGGFGVRSVGGIAIDAEGIVQNVEPRALETLAEERRDALAGQSLPAAATELRKVSLAQVIAAVGRATAAGGPVAADVALLGGLERITHVFVDPEAHDIVLAGPGGAPTVDAAGTLVAAQSGRPLLHLEDLVTALRAIDGARQGGMTCSIDPTPEGIARVKRFLAANRSIGSRPDAVLRGMEEAIGLQKISVDGIPADSRFARVLVAADYRLKRIGMGLEASGIDALPSYLALIPPGRNAAAIPRFWLEADYDPIAHDPDKLAWRIAGRRMKCLTQSRALAAEGERAGAADPIADRWCQAMTVHYDAVAAKHPIFSELVGCVDLAVVAALIQGQQLAARAGLDLGPLLDAEKLPLPAYEVASSVPTVANGVKKGSAWVVSASGGVLLQPWEFATNLVSRSDVAPIRAGALDSRPADGWWWD